MDRPNLVIVVVIISIFPGRTKFPLENGAFSRIAQGNRGRTVEDPGDVLKSCLIAGSDWIGRLSDRYRSGWAIVILLHQQKLPLSICGEW